MTKKLISRHKGCQLLVIEPMHCGSNSILKVRFLGHPVHLKTIWSESMPYLPNSVLCGIPMFKAGWQNPCVAFTSSTSSPPTAHPWKKGRCGNMWGRWDPLDTWLQLTFTWSHASFSALLWVSVQGIQRPSQKHAHRTMHLRRTWRSMP